MKASRNFDQTTYHCGGVSEYLCVRVCVCVCLGGDWHEFFEGDLFAEKYFFKFLSCQPRQSVHDISKAM